MGAMTDVDGLTYIREVRDGTRAGDPFMVMAGIRVVEAEAGRVTMECTPAAEHGNMGGFAHGGYLSTILDSVTGYALHTTLEPGHTPPHLSASYRFIAMARIGVTLRATAEVLKTGRRIGHVRADLRDAADRLVATGETTHAVMPLPSPGSSR
jgi:acyl-CoA thioesterase